MWEKFSDVDEYTSEICGIWRGCGNRSKNEANRVIKWT